MKNVGILTAGGDSPGLNAAIRAFGKSVIRQGYHLLGFKDGFDGLAFNNFMELEERTCSGILTIGGTILRTSRNKPNKMPKDGQIVDMTDEIVANYKKNKLDCLVCIGGGGTHKSALQLQKAGLNIITMPKTIDNDVAFTDTSIGFDTALSVATLAIDALHSTASSHKRIILVEIMGHNAGWLTLGSGLAGGADIILIPEIPYEIDQIALDLKKREKDGKLFSIMPIAEGAMSVDTSKRLKELQVLKNQVSSKKEKASIKAEIDKLTEINPNRTFDLAKNLQEKTGMETRVTILGHLQRGGTPSAGDRLLATKLGNSCAEALFNEKFGFMVASDGEKTKLVPIEDVANNRKCVPLEHAWVHAANSMGVSFGSSKTESGK